MNMKKLAWFFSLIAVLSFVDIRAVNFYNRSLNSDSVYVVNKKNDMPVIEKNIHKKRSPASLTKVMTYIVASENIKDAKNENVLVTKEILDMVDPDSSGCKLKEGEEVSVLNLYHCMLICSSGCAAITLANHIGGIENFVNLMNAKAESLGCENTHFVNPDGMYDQNQYSTAYDMYLIVSYAMKNQEFLDIVYKKEYSCFGDERDPIITTNKMIDKKRGGEYYCPYVKGIKTGYLDDAGRCLASYAVKDGESYVSVVMGGPVKDENDRKIEKNMAMIDTKNIYSWAFEKLKFLKCYDKGQPIKEINLGVAWETDKIFLVAQNDVFFTVPKDVKFENLTININCPDSIDAPVEQGDVIGKADIFYNDTRLGEFNLVAASTHKKSFFAFFTKILRSIMYSPLVIFLFVVFLIFSVFYMIVFFRGIKRKKMRSKIKKFPKIKK